MERSETMITPTDFFGEAIKGLLFAAIGWFASNFNTQRKFDAFETRVVAPLRDRVAIFEGATRVFVTREELKSEITSLRTDFKDAVGELKSLIRELRTER